MATIQPTPAPSFTETLLSRAHSPTSAARIFAEKIQHKPLSLVPTTSKPKDARAARTQHRATAEAARPRKAKNKPKPLSAKQKRAFCVYDISPEELKFSIYEGLHSLWCKYMREILGLKREGLSVEDARAVNVTPAHAGPRIASADLHGAMMSVVRSGCVGRVGTKGIVIRETKLTVMIITKNNKAKTIPKEGTVFRIEVRLVEGEFARDVSPLAFDLHGDAMSTRPPERANKKFKMHIPKDL